MSAVASPDGPSPGPGRTGAGAGDRGDQVLERLALLPGGPQLLERAQAHEDLELVGGAVRDILRGEQPLELDVVLGGEPATFTTVAVALASELAAELGGDLTAHGRFGTAVLTWRQGRIDIAARRTETYADPGALPDVLPGDPEQDLARRDFTVNAIAVALGGEHRGRLRAVQHALADLFEERLRVLHPASFIDDPTRLLRLCRYVARLGFAIEQETQLLAQQALAAGALATVSQARIGAELKLLLAERDPLATLIALQDAGVLGRLEGRLRLDAETLAAALELLPDDGRRDMLALASLLIAPAAAGESGHDPVAAASGHDAEWRVATLLDGWECTASERRTVLYAALHARSLARDLAASRQPSQLWRLLRGVPVEAVALAGGLGGAQGDPLAQVAAHSWLQTLRGVRLQITGDDLLAAGLAPGPQIGRGLERALCKRLDGALADGRDAELQAALAEEPR